MQNSCYQQFTNFVGHKPDTDDSHKHKLPFQVPNVSNYTVLGWFSTIVYEKNCFWKFQFHAPENNTSFGDTRFSLDSEDIQKHNIWGTLYNNLAVCVNSMGRQRGRQECGESPPCGHIEMAKRHNESMKTWQLYASARHTMWSVNVQ